MHAQDDSAVLLCQSLAPRTLPTAVSCLAEQILLHFEFSAIFHQVGMHLAQMHPIKLHRFNLHVFLSPDQVPKRFSKLPRDFYITFQRTFCLSSCRLYSRILLHPHRRELSSKFQFEFQVQFVARSVRPRPSSEIHLKFLRTPCLSLFRVYSRTLLHPSSREPSSKFKFLFKFRRTLFLTSLQVCFSIPAY